MNTRSMFSKMAIAGVAAVAPLLGATSASAGPSWGVGIALPGISVGVSEPGHFRQEPVYGPAPVVYDRPAPPVGRFAPGYEAVGYGRYGAPRPVYEEQPHRWDDRGGRGDHWRWEREHSERPYWRHDDRGPDWNGRR